MVYVIYVFRVHSALYAIAEIAPAKPAPVAPTPAAAAPTPATATPKRETQMPRMKKTVSNVTFPFPIFHPENLGVKEGSKEEYKGSGVHDDAWLPPVDMQKEFVYYHQHKALTKSLTIADIKHMMGAYVFNYMR